MNNRNHYSKPVRNLCGTAGAATPGVDISVIVPVYDEAENVQPLADQIEASLSRQRRSYEIIFVDDGSSDATWQQIQKAHQHNARVCGFQHCRNAGQSAAVWTGIQASSGSIIATLDGDLQNDPADFVSMLEELQNVPFVSGKRVKRNDSWVRKLSSKVARAARKFVLKVDVQDTGCGIRVFRRSALEGIFPFKGFHRFLPVLVQGAGVRISEVPVNHRSRVAGTSKYGVWNRLWCGLYDLIAVAWLLKRRIDLVPFTELDGIEHPGVGLEKQAQPQYAPTALLDFAQKITMAGTRRL